MSVRARVSEHPVPTDWFEKTTLGTLPERAARRWGEREAIVFRERRLSFEAVAAAVDRAARALIALGVRPGDTVALWMVNRPEWIEKVKLREEALRLRPPADVR
jgi:acyl-CoA synthetase (AMP-forming)/AMP-acid ligase II